MVEPTSVDAEIENGLSTLINLSGKMRMLSHRVAMFALLAAHESNTKSLQEFDAALSNFSALVNTIQNGNPSLGISVSVAHVLEQSRALPEPVLAIIKRFNSQAQQIQAALKRSDCSIAQLSTFTNFVATDLLQALNEITNSISNTLKERLDLRLTHEDHTRKAVRTAIASINNVSQRVKLISLNASIEASHAGENGRGFSLIAAEIRALSEEAARVTKGIIQQIS